MESKLQHELSRAETLSRGAAWGNILAVYYIFVIFVYILFFLNRKIVLNQLMSSCGVKVASMDCFGELGAEHLSFYKVGMQTIIYSYTWDDVKSVYLPLTGNNSYDTDVIKKLMLAKKRLCKNKNTIYSYRKLLLH